jgi:DNA-binding HxlR family transcriptional regulator
MVSEIQFYLDKETKRFKQVRATVKKAKKPMTIQQLQEMEKEMEDDFNYEIF